MEYLLQSFARDVRTLVRDRLDDPLGFRGLVVDVRLDPRELPGLARAD